MLLFFPYDSGYVCFLLSPKHINQESYVILTHATSIIRQTTTNSKLHHIIFRPIRFNGMLEQIMIRMEILRLHSVYLRQERGAVVY